MTNHPEFTPISLVDIIAEDVGTPRNDGTEGSALYSVPIRLSGSAPGEWAALFVQAWDRPPIWTTMHRPGIARVSGDRIILSRTTLDEIERYHKETLKLAVGIANEKYVELQQKKGREEERARLADLERRKNIDEAAKRITFE